MPGKKHGSGTGDRWHGGKGNRYDDMPVFADESLARDKEIAFNADSHRELVRLTWEDFVRLVEPKTVKFAAGNIDSTAA